jgi:hypothetical protein
VKDEELGEGEREAAWVSVEHGKHRAARAAEFSLDGVGRESKKARLERQSKNALQIMEGILKGLHLKGKGGF